MRCLVQRYGQPPVLAEVQCEGFHARVKVDCKQRNCAGCEQCRTRKYTLADDGYTRGLPLIGAMPTFGLDSLDWQLKQGAYVLLKKIGESDKNGLMVKRLDLDVPKA